MQVSKNSQARLPLSTAAQPASPQPLQRELETERDGGELFATELDRAAQPKTGEGHRTERQRSEARQTRQNERADQAETVRTEAREGRTQRSEQRGERGKVSDSRLRSAYNDANPKRPETEPTRPAPEREVTRAEEPATRAEQGDPYATRDVSRRAQTAFAPPGPQPVAANQPTQASPVAAPQAVGQGTGHQGTSGQPQSSVATQPTGRTAVSAPQAAEATFKDVLGEMLLTKEAELSREASILRQVKARLAPGSREISMQLSPASLGKIDMRIALRSGRMTAVVRASKQEALDALRNQLPELTAGLEAQGIEVVEFDLGLRTA